MSRGPKKSAFTLVELLVVITIMVVLISVIAVSSYGMMVKQTRVEVAVDTILSRLGTVRGQVENGYREEVEVSPGVFEFYVKCLGLNLNKLTGEVRTFEIDYDESTWRCDYIGLEAAVADSELVGLPDNVGVFGIEADPGGLMDSLNMVFIPPKARVRMVDEEGIELGLVKTVEVAVRYGDDPDLEKIIRINQVTGRAEMLKKQP